MSGSVAVVGGGLAGITAALRLADEGRQVTLFEATPRLGGLTHSFQRADVHVDNGQHVFLRCCKAYLGLLDRLGVADRVFLQPRLDISLQVPGRPRPARLRRTGLPAPFHLGASLLRYSALAPADRVRAVTAALALRRVALDDPAVDAVSFADWLAGKGQNQRIVAALWDVFTVATVNLPAARTSLTLAAKVFQTGLLTDATAGDIGWSLVPLSELHGEPAARALVASGARLRLRSKVIALERLGAQWQLTDRDGNQHLVDQVVLAVPPAQAEQLLPSGTLGQDPGWAEALGSSPIINAHIVLDRTVLRLPFLAGIGSPLQWVFDRTRQSGIAGGQYLAASISAAEDLIDVGTEQLRDLVLPALYELIPAARTAQVRDFFVTRERHATFRGLPGTARLRPAAVTREPGLALAGAWTDTGWPATMESAVLSGHAAAQVLLDGVRPAVEGIPS